MSARGIVRHKRIGWTIPGLFAALVLLTGVGLFIWGRYQDVEGIARHLEAARPWLAAWRGLLFLVLIGGWPYWVNVMARRRNWSEDRRITGLALRWRLAAWLLILELVLVQNLAGRFIRALPGVGS